MREHPLLLVLTAAICARPASGNPVTRYHMVRHFGDLLDITHLLLAGKLDDARTRAFLLTRPPGDQAVEAAAAALGRAASISDACRLTAKVAEACASCHVQIPRVWRAPAVPEEPPPEPNLEVRMQRHQWAADRLWEGVVLGDDRRWRQGLEVLAMRPVPMPKDDRLAYRLQAMAVDSLGQLEQRSDTYVTRAHAYGEMLVTCTACHRRQ
jgi:cytochrome c553